MLFVASDPRDATRIRTMEEFREIDQALWRARLADQFHVEVTLSARARDVHEAMLRHRPEIVHVAGHGAISGAVLENDQGEATLAPAQWLGAMLAAPGTVRCVLLSMCQSAAMAELLVARGAAPAAMGWDGDVADGVAIGYSVAFYTALAYGCTLAQAHEQAAAGVFGDGTAPVWYG